MVEYNEDSLFYWFPLVKGLDIPIPKTIEVPLDWDLGDICDLVDGKITEKVKRAITKVKKAANDIGFPVFIRGDQSANKHEWSRSCFLTKSIDTQKLMIQLADFSVMVDIGIQGYVVREFLDLDWKFHSHNGMPVAAERRYFVRDGKVECWHPYWPETAIKKPDSKNWLKELRELQTPTPKELAILAEYAKMVGNAVKGYWSVDFCRHKNGTWYLTDMARGDDSYHWSTCPNAPCSMLEYGKPTIDGDGSSDGI
jgi:hypothetical protein